MKVTATALYQIMLALAANAATVPASAWSTLTPDTVLGPTTDYSTFGIYIQTIDNSTVSSSAADASAIVSQITDGQIQATTSAAEVVSQIGDGQIQATTATAQVVSQIGDGQIQATTETYVNSTTAQVVSQIGDGQIQATTATTAPVVSQIGDGQIQATTAITAQVVSQIGDGQIQATTSTEPAISQIDDGQIQATTLAAKVKRDTVGCASSEALTMELADTILTDSKGRIGSIVANRQFQFDGPPPQAGAIYAAGWSITEDGNLAIGSTTVFYECLSGTFYNLYDEDIGSECYAVNLKVTDLVDCS